MWHSIQISARQQMAPHDVLLAFFLISSSISLLYQSQKAEAARVMASVSDCQRKCGDVEIPYPFGMTKGCYLDEPFEVTCNESTGSATIARLKGEVDTISIPNHNVRIKGFDVRPLQFDKSGKSFYGHFFDNYSLGNHYAISHKRNRFIAMGCDFYAYLVDDKTKELLGGCASLCNITDVVLSPSSPCSGLNCCQMNITKDRRNLILHVDTIHTLGTSWTCGVFTFVDKNFTLSKIDFSACQESFRVPVTYDWTVGNTSCKNAMGGDDYVCGQNTKCINSKTGIGYKCKCRDGFTGNPYVREGCQDIDECANQEDYNCPAQHLCVNREGSYLCLPNRKHMLLVLIALGIGLAVCILTLVGIGLWIWRKLKKMNDRKTKQRFFKKNGGLLLQQHISSSKGSVLPALKLFKIEELERATERFSESRILGKGGLGTVYKGMLSDGRIVAVKKANITDDSQVSQFINEVFILSQISHRHIVKLLGCCLESEVPLLVYEYVSNGTLSHHIHDEPNISISWENRLRIATEVAGALAYLHSYASTAIFHRDIKSSNILLDENYRAVISDFGLARSVSTDRTHLTTFVGGTFGYLDPEYFQTGQLNDKSDVYAFGVVLAEILTGQKAVSSVKDDIGLALRFRSAVKEHCLFEILEEVVANEGQKDQILAVAKLAKRCLKVNARKRPCMKEVAAELDQLRKAKELPAHEERFHDEHRSICEKCYRAGIDSEAEDD